MVPPPPSPPSPPPLTCSYQYFSQSLTFDAAEATCIAAGGNLASIHSVQEASDVYTTANQQDSWIGLLYSTQGEWTWTDGSTYGSDIIGAGSATELWHAEATRVASEALAGLDR